MKQKYLSLLIPLVIFTACGGEKTASERADELCARLMTMDTHNHVDIPMKTGEVPGLRVNLRNLRSENRNL